jgi:hypothetical protein
MKRKDIRAEVLVNENLVYTVEQFDRLLVRYEDATYEACAMVLLALQLRQTGDQLDHIFSQLCANLRSDHPLMGETFTTIGSALCEIAQAINDYTTAYEARAPTRTSHPNAMQFDHGSFQSQSQASNSDPEGSPVTADFASLKFPIR